MIPTVVTLCTAPSIGAERVRGSGYWNVTGKDSVLLELFFSPGTGCTVAVTV